MELREIKALLALMRDFGLSELEIEDKKGKVRLVRASDSADENHSASGRRSPARRVARGNRSRAVGLGGPISTRGRRQRRNSARAIATCRARWSGTFYRAASPDSDPFVEEGASVRKGQAAMHHRSDEDDERDRGRDWW